MRPRLLREAHARGLAGNIPDKLAIGANPLAHLGLHLGCKAGSGPVRGWPGWSSIPQNNHRIKRLCCKVRHSAGLRLLLLRSTAGLGLQIDRRSRGATPAAKARSKLPHGRLGGLRLRLKCRSLLISHDCPRLTALRTIVFDLIEILRATESWHDVQRLLHLDHGFRPFPWPLYLWFDPAKRRSFRNARPTFVVACLTRITGLRRMNVRSSHSASTRSF